MANGWDFIQESAQRNLFSTQEMRDSEKIGRLQDVYLEELIPFKNHTFKVLDDEKMNKLMQSIEENGIIQPGIAFYNEESQLELVSGHRRYRALQLLGRETIPVLIKTMTRDEAIVAMVTTNLETRDEILPSEKAFSYKAMLEAMNRQGKRSDLTSDPVGWKLAGKETAHIIGEKSGDSQTQVRRYIRLTHLVPELLDIVDKKKKGIRPAVEISYLPAHLQECLVDIYESNEITPSLSQTIQMKKLYQQGLLDEEKINEIMMELKPNQKENFRLSDKIIDRYFKGCDTKAERENRIIMALELLEKQEKILWNKTKNEQFMER